MGYRLVGCQNPKSVRDGVEPEFDYAVSAGRVPISGETITLADSTRWHVAAVEHQIFLREGEDPLSAPMVFVVPA